LSGRLGLDGHVHFLGFRTHRQLRDLVKAADLLVMSSVHEAGPMVLLEAAIAGVPTVGTAVGHLVEWAPSAALAVPVGDAAALASGIERLLNDENGRLHMAGIAQHRAIVEDADYTARAFETLYLEVLGPLSAIAG
jgi:glycosyltransferase involved in cell wall biosynthesis